MSYADRWMNGEWEFHLVSGHCDEWKVTLDGEVVKGVKSFNVSAEVGDLPVISLTIIPSRCNLFVDKAKSVDVECMTADVTAIGDTHKGRIPL